MPSESDRSIITEEIGNIFASPRGSVLIHACNTQGAWGSGVALQFKERYPDAYQAYHSFCTRKVWGGIQPQILGTALLITPDERTPWFAEQDRQLEKDGFYIACLFTSQGYGRNVDTPEKILENTAKALNDLADQISIIKRDQHDDQPALDFSYSKESAELTHIRECRAVRINSGRFGVPWKRTRKVLKKGPLHIVVVRPEGEPEVSEESDIEIIEIEDDIDENRNAAVPEIEQEAGKDTAQETGMMKGSARKLIPRKINTRIKSQKPPKTSSESTQRRFPRVRKRKAESDSDGDYGPGYAKIGDDTDGDSLASRLTRKPKASLKEKSNVRAGLRYGLMVLEDVGRRMLGEKEDITFGEQI